MKLFFQSEDDLAVGTGRKVNKLLHQIDITLLIISKCICLLQFFSPQAPAMHATMPTYISPGLYYPHLVQKRFSIHRYRLVDGREEIYSARKRFTKGEIEILYKIVQLIG